LKDVTGQSKLKPMKTDKGQFDEVLRRLIEKNPKKTAEIAAQNEDDARTRKFRRKRNPETDPQKIAEFNLDRKHPPIKH
jgi:predicted CopG family antitoxin